MCWLDNDESGFFGESPKEKREREERNNRRKAEKGIGIGGLGGRMCHKCGETGIPNGHKCPRGCDKSMWD